MIYPYVKTSLLLNPTNYSYSPATGKAFINEWRQNRLDYLNKQNFVPVEPTSKYHLDKYVSQNQLTIGLFLLRKYETTKKIRDCYVEGRGNQDMSYENFFVYINAAKLFNSIYKKTKKIQFLNCLSKLCDLFISDDRFDEYSDDVASLIRDEMHHVSNIADKLKYAYRYGVQNISDEGISNANLFSNNFSHSKFNNNEFGLICCGSSRSSIYLQGILSHNIRPSCIIYMNKSSHSRYNDTYSYPDLKSPEKLLFVPTNYIDPRQIANTHGIPLIICNVETINDDLVLHQMKNSKLLNFVYSGFSGQIVGSQITSQFNILHMHPGDLPDFKGSTTFYYSILQNLSPCVSAIVMNDKIDQGQILLKSEYFLPSINDDIDLLFEPCIRTDTLIRLLKSISFNSIDFRQNLYNANSLNNEEYFYIIHPVLKNLAINSLKH